MINVGICDDEKIIAAQIENMVLDISTKEKIPVNIDVFYSGNTLEKEILQGTYYDLLFLDIYMKNGDGITAAKNIRKMDENVLFIFVSGYDKYALELFRLDVFEFLKKPILYDTFKDVFLRAIRKVGEKDYYFIYHYRGNEFKVPYMDIMYFESSGRKILVHLKNVNVKSSACH